MPEAPSALPTRDLIGVELMAAGGPFKGKGSPPEGDYFTEDDLREYARDTMAVLDEIRPFVKIGHSPEQTLARRSGFYSDDDQPATGRWTNFRVENGRLLADAMKVPAKLADLIEVGAFGRRSVETKPYESQAGKGRFDKVIRAVAWLGAKAPAIKTLDDVVALYGDDEIGDPDLLTIDFEEGGTAVLDLNVDLSTISTTSDEESESSADTRVMPETTTETNEAQAALALSEEQRDTLAEILGIDGDVTPSALIARAQEMRTLSDAHEVEGEEEEDGDESGDEEESEMTTSGRLMSDAEYYDLLSRANAGARAAERLAERERDELLEGAMRTGRLDPAQRDEFVRLYEENPDLVSRVIESLPENEERARIYGSDEEPEMTDADEALYRAFAEQSGVPATTTGGSA